MQISRCMAEVSPCVLLNIKCKHNSTEMKRRRKRQPAMHTGEDEKDKSRKVNDISGEQSKVSDRKSVV